MFHGRTLAQALSRWLSTMEVRVQARDWSCGICGGQIDFLRVLQFPLPILILPIVHQSPSPII
jgi:hypothetical protein